MQVRTQLEGWFADAARRIREVESSAHPVCQVHGAVEQLEAVLAELRRADEQLREQVEALGEARAALEAERERCRELFRSSPLGYIVTDMDAVVTGVNPAGAALLRHECAELVGRALPEFIALPDRRLFRRHLCSLLENPESGEWQTRLEVSGSLITISVGLSVQFVDQTAGEARGLRWVVRDLRELRRAQSEAMAREEAARRAGARRTQRLEEENRLLRGRLGDRAPRSGSGRSRPG